MHHGFRLLTIRADASDDNGNKPEALGYFLLQKVFHHISKKLFSVLYNDPLFKPVIQISSMYLRNGLSEATHLRLDYDEYTATEAKWHEIEINGKLVKKFMTDD